MPHDTPSAAQTLQKKFSQAGISPEYIAPGDMLAEYESVFISNIKTDAPAATVEKPAAVSQQRDAPLIAVIVETRKNYNLKFVINQMHKLLKVPIQLFHGPGNLDFIKNSNLNRLIASGDLTLTALSADKVDAGVYNQLLLSEGFWNALIGRQKILIFQTDSIVCPRSAYTVEDFFDFDYIGSGWPRDRPNGHIVDGGNGGFCLRDWGKSVECLRRFPLSKLDHAEDVYFSFHMELTGGRVGKIDDCDKFSSQWHFRFASFGAHKLHQMSSFERLRFLFYCPCAWRILPRVRQIGNKMDQLLR